MRETRMAVVEGHRIGYEKPVFDRKIVIRDPLERREAELLAELNAIRERRNGDLS